MNSTGASNSVNCSQSCKYAQGKVSNCTDFQEDKQSCVSKKRCHGKFIIVY